MNKLGYHELLEYALFFVIVMIIILFSFCIITHKNLTVIEKIGKKNGKYKRGFLWQITSLMFTDLKV